MKARDERSRVHYAPPPPAPCVACGRPCVAAQRNEQGQPEHISCRDRKETPMTGNDMPLLSGPILSRAELAELAGIDIDEIDEED